MFKSSGNPANISTYYCYEGSLVELNALMFIACRAGLEPVDGARFSRISPPPNSEPLYLQTFVGFAPHWSKQSTVEAIFA